MQEQEHNIHNTCTDICTLILQKQIIPDKYYSICLSLILKL